MSLSLPTKIVEKAKTKIKPKLRLVRTAPSSTIKKAFRYSYLHPEVIKLHNLNLISKQSLTHFSVLPLDYQEFLLQVIGTRIVNLDDKQIEFLCRLLLRNGKQVAPLSEAIDKLVNAFSQETADEMIVDEFTRILDEVSDLPKKHQKRVLLKLMRKLVNFYSVRFDEDSQHLKTIWENIEKME